MNVRDLTICTLTLAALVALAGCSNPAKSYVATVNGEGIARAAFDQLVDKNILKFEKMGNRIDETQRADFKQRLLDNLVIEKVVLQQAKTLGVVVAEKTVDGRIADIKARYSGEDEFRKILESQMVSESELRDMMRNQLIMEALFAKEVRVPQVTEADIAAYYEQNQARFNIPEQVRASHVLLKYEGAAGTPEEVQQKSRLAQIRKDILGRKISFADAAKRYSDCPSKEQGGDLDYFSRGRMVPEFEKTAFATAVGQVSDIVKTRFGFHILTVTDKKPPQKQTLADVSAKIAEDLKKERQRQATHDYIEKLKSGAKIKIYLEKPAEKK